MIRQKPLAERDTWRVSDSEAGLWVAREVAPGWRIEHRVVVQRANPVIIETRVRWPEGADPPVGGLGSDVLRQITVRGVRDAAQRRLADTGHSGGDLRALESVSPATRRLGEARRWSLAVASLAYVRAVQEGSVHPNEDAGRALGLSARTVRDRIYAARHMTPPLLTGGGRRGVVGLPEMTEASWRVMNDRIWRTMAALRLPPDRVRLHPFWKPTVSAFAAVFGLLLRVAESRMPGFWDMSLEEIARRAANLPPPVIEDPLGMELDLTPLGLVVVDRREGSP